MVSIYNNSMDADQCTWYFGDGTMSVDYHPGSHTYPYDIGNSYVLTLVAQSDSGCVDSMQQVIAFYDDLLYYVPNSFIPDGDNVNDVWLPVFSSGIDENQYQLYVFNRWGNVVFETNDYQQGWDGTYKGEPAQIGTYTYKIVFKLYSSEGKEVVLGHINLLR